jgi:LPXTG-motif cell wall-anchored protein
MTWKKAGAQAFVVGVLVAMTVPAEARSRERNELGGEAMAAQQNHRRPKRFPVPEFDPASAGAIAALLAGGALLIVRRRRR